MTLEQRARHAEDQRRYRAKMGAAWVAMHTGHVAAWRSRNPEKYAAHTAVNNAVRDGRLAKPTECERCARTTRLEGSHDDYSRPLEVEWLCRRCHVDKDRGYDQQRRSE